MNTSLVLGALTLYLIGLTVVLALLHAEGERGDEERRSGDEGTSATDGGVTMDQERGETRGERQEPGT